MHRRLVIGLMGLGFVVACAGGSGTGGGDFGGGGSSGGGASSSSAGASSGGSAGGSGSGNSGNGSGSNSSGNGSTSGSQGNSSSGNSGSNGGSSSSAAGSNSSSGNSNSSGGSSSSSNGGSSSGAGSTMPTIPAVVGTCPTISPGASGASLTFAGEPVSVWTGSGGQNGALVLFWFETSGNANDVTIQFGTAQIAAVTAQGGMVASFAKSTGTGTNTGDLVWYTDDFKTADQVVACAVQQVHIDPRRIFVTGASAGGLQTTWMAYARSSYIAAAASISGGMTGAGGFNLDPPPEDPSNIPAAMAIHGAQGVDSLGLDFAVASAAWEADVKMRGGFSLDCNTGGGHVSGPPAICPGIWQFFQDHPFGARPPYSPVPSVFPSYCQVGPRLADGGAP